MKKNKLWIVGWMLAVTCSVFCEESSHKTAQIAIPQLSADEMAFAAQLDDKNRKSFHDRLSAAQREAVMIAVKNGADANLAVQNMLIAQEMKKTRKEEHEIFK